MINSVVSSFTASAPSWPSAPSTLPTLGVAFAEAIGGPSRSPCASVREMSLDELEHSARMTVLAEVSLNVLVARESWSCEHDFGR